MKRGQSAIEFLILVGAMLFVFVLFLGLFQKNIGEKIVEKRNYALTELALTIQNEINLASEASNGYSRTFEIPKDILGSDYDVNITSGMVYARTRDGVHALALPAQNVTGDMNKTSNTIRKVNGTIYLNTNPP